MDHGVLEVMEKEVMIRIDESLMKSLYVECNVKVSPEPSGSRIPRGYPVYL